MGQVAVANADAGYAREFAASVDSVDIAASEEGVERSRHCVVGSPDCCASHRQPKAASVDPAAAREREVLPGANLFPGYAASVRGMDVALVAQAVYHWDVWDGRVGLELGRQLLSARSQVMDEYSWVSRECVP